MPYQYSGVEETSGARCGDGCREADRCERTESALYLHQYATVVSTLPSHSSVQTTDSTWPLQSSSPSPQEDESVMMSISCDIHESSQSVP